MTSVQGRWRFKRWFSAGLLVLSMCAPQYDEATDKSISALHQQVEGEIVRLVGLARRIASLSGQDVSAQPVLTRVCANVPASRQALAAACSKASYDQNIAFYDAVETDLSSLKLRLDARSGLSTEKLDNLVRQIHDIILDPKNSLQSEHSLNNVLVESFLSATRAQLNVLFQTLLRYELNLKSGKSAS